MLPILMSASLGVYLARLQAKKPPQAWSLFGGSTDPDAPVVLKPNELKGRSKAMQYPGNSPC